MTKETLTPKAAAARLRLFGIDAPKSPAADSPGLLAAITAFQEMFELPPTGNLTKEVQRELQRDPSLEPGSQGPHVERLQNKLRDKGFRLRVDGQFSLDVLNALKEYQGNVGLPRTGVVDADTWAALYE